MTKADDLIYSTNPNLKNLIILHTYKGLVTITIFLKMWMSWFESFITSGNKLHLNFIRIVDKKRIKVDLIQQDQLQ